VGVFSRRKRESALPASTATGSPRAITAAAAKESFSNRASIDEFNTRTRESVKWQTEAWDYYDEIGEIAYAVDLLANITSKVLLHAAVVPEGQNGWRPVGEVDDLTPRLGQAAEMALERLHPADGTIQDIIRDFVLNLTVSGECYLVRSPALIGSGTRVSWDVRSISEILVSGRDAFILEDPRGIRKTAINESAGYYVARVWTAHPRFKSLPHSSMRGVLDLCAELQLINTTFRATARSRLNAGMLFIPDTLSVSGPQGYEDNVGDPDDEYESFEDELMDSMTTPIQDETNASAVVPLLVRGPTEAGAAIQYIKFDRVFDEQLKERADRVLERILQGIDLPKDVVSGLANVKYSNAVKIDESLYKQHIEPLVQRICNSITTAYLRPVLEAQGFSREQAARVGVWFDPSSVIASPDLTATSEYAHANYLISDEAWLHYNGFDPADAPDPEEVARRVAFAKGQVLPEYLDKVLQTYAPKQTAAVQEAAAEESPGTALPPEIIQALGGKPSDTSPPEAPPTPTPPAPETPAPTEEPTA
jgi:hypothetical protein